MSGPSLAFTNPDDPRLDRARDHLAGCYCDVFQEMLRASRGELRSVCLMNQLDRLNAAVEALRELSPDFPRDYQRAISAGLALL